MANNNLLLVTPAALVVNIISESYDFSVDIGNTTFSIRASIETEGGSGQGGGEEFTQIEKNKLAGIEFLSKDDLTGSEIKVLYELEGNTNAFDDAALSKLAGIEPGATGDLSNAEIKTAYELNGDTNAFNDAAIAKLANIENAATADQTGGEIKTLYELESDTNAFTDLEQAKLGDIEADATTDQTGGEIKTLYELESDTNAFTDGEKTKLAGIMAGATDDLTGAEIKTLYENEAQTNAFNDAAVSKLAAIEAGATADQTNNEIRTAVEAASDSNVFTDTDHSKLNAIEAGATTDQTDSEIETAYNAQVAKISAGEITAGTEVTVRRVSPADLKAIVLAHETGGGGGDPNPDQVSPQEIIDGTETALRSFSPDDIEAMAQLHGGGGFPANPVITGKLSWLTDVVLERDGAGILAQRDGANNQRQRWYAWYTDASNGEWGECGWSGGVFYLGSFANGSGTGRSIGFVTDGTARWAISATGDFAPSVDNTHDIGLSGSNRPKDMFLAGTLSLLNITANKPSMVISGYSLTGANAQNMVDLSGTWNTTGSPTVIYADMLDTASGAGTMLVNLKVGGVSMFSVTKAGAVTAISGLGGTMSDAEVKTAYENNDNTNAHTDAQVTKLAGIDTAAKDDQTGAEIKTLYQSEANAYTDTKNTKLAGIETAATADQTDGEIASAYGNQVAQISGGEITAGTETALRTSSPADLKAMVDAHSGGGPDIDHYDLGMDFLGKPTDAQVIARWIVLREITMPADFSGAGGNILTNPTGALVIDIKDDGTTIGTISIATDGVFTFTTVSGTEKVVAAGSLVTAIGPGSADATGEDIVFTLPGAL